MPGVLITEVADTSRPSSPRPSSPGARRPLPRHVHLAMITESVLRDAPFAAHNKALWRSVVRSAAFAELSTDGFWWFNTNVVEPRDRGELEARPDAAADALFGHMAVSYVTLFKAVSAQQKDACFGRFYEAMAYSILLTLDAFYPKRHSFLDDRSLKRRVLALCCEWSTGIQPSDFGEEHWILDKDTHADHGRKGHAPPKAKARLAVDESAAGQSQLEGLGSSAARSGPREQREPLVRASYTLQHSPFFSRFLGQDSSASSSRSKFKLGLTMDMGRVKNLVANHVPDDERRDVERRVNRAMRASSQPLPVRGVLASSAAARRAVMEEYSRHKTDATAAISSIHRERRRVLAAIDAEEKQVLDSDDLREYSMKLVKSYQS